MKSQFISVEALSLSDRTAMFDLLNQHFEFVTWEGFQVDLDRKNWALLLKDDQVLKGFSTLKFGQTTFADQRINVVYSGDTIIDPTAWSSTVLPRAWISAVNWLQQQDPQHRLYWLLICSGFRTYRFLPIFWQEFYPRYDRATPPDAATLLTHLAKEYYGDRYQQETGIVRFDRPQVLRKGLIEIPSGRQTNPHVQFFMSQNSGYSQGNELVCLTEIHADNLTAAGARMWQANSSIEWAQSPVLVSL